MSSSSAAKVERLEARVSREQKALFQRAAEIQGRTLTDFMIASVHEAAGRVSGHIARASGFTFAREAR